MSWIDLILVLLVYVIGALISLVITGFMVNKFVIKKIMENEDIQDIVRLVKEGKDALKDIVENQNHAK